jgi:hypothetical protein
VKPGVAGFIRVLLILVAGLVGLIGLLMSACGGILLLGGAKGGSLVVLGLACIAACAAFVAWVSSAGHRTLSIILYTLLGLLLIAALVWQTQMHGRH